MEMTEYEKTMLEISALKAQVVYIEKMLEIIMRRLGPERPGVT